MSIKQKLRNLLFIALVGVAILGNAPMRPEEIEDLLRQMNQPKVAHTLSERNDDGDDEPDSDLG